MTLIVREACTVRDQSGMRRWEPSGTGVWRCPCSLVLASCRARKPQPGRTGGLSKPRAAQCCSEAPPEQCRFLLANKLSFYTYQLTRHFQWKESVSGKKPCRGEPGEQKDFEQKGNNGRQRKKIRDGRWQNQERAALEIHKMVRELFFKTQWCHLYKDNEIWWKSSIYI